MWAAHEIRKHFQSKWVGLVNFIGGVRASLYFLVKLAFSVDGRGQIQAANYDVMQYAAQISVGN